ncbi:MAG: uridylate kinase [Clostridia bacterium]|nr:uridylate kinase [Clostridia bacterium]
MAAFDCDLVGKIGSMALIRRRDKDIDYNIFARLGADLKPGMIWVSSGATEIGRLDYLKRNGSLLQEDEMAKTDYAAQGQSILMEWYRRFISPQYSVRQVLVEHQHFNDAMKREHIRTLLLRAQQQNAIPIINYNDPVSDDENRHMELMQMRWQRGEEAHIVECIDNDETAAVIATMMKARILLIMTSVEGIYEDPEDPSTLVREIGGKDTDEVLANVREMQRHCVGASRPGANGAKAKLEFIADPVQNGTTVIIGHARHHIRELVEGTVPRTIIAAR